MRVERETLRRFPQTACVLFTIRTYIAPMSTVAADAVSAAALGDAVTAMSRAVRGYKDLVGLGDAVASHLTARSPQRVSARPWFPRCAAHTSGVVVSVVPQV